MLKQEQQTSNKARLIGYVLGIVIAGGVIAWRLLAR